jgi:NAD(P)-dependent dehydrogenase (short-subunit alcohol dehydrogenase family)
MKCTVFILGVLAGVKFYGISTVQIFSTTNTFAVILPSRETAAALAGMGARVVMACRNLNAAEKVAEEIRAKHPGASVVVGPCALDLGSQDSVKRYAAAYRKKGWPIHVLVNNAGALYQGEPWFTPEGVGGPCQVNYLGAYTLTREFESVLKRSSPSRVVNVSSITHRFGKIGNPNTFLTNWGQGSRYANTKLANVLFAFELQRRWGEAGVCSCAVDPGSVGSSIWKDSLFGKPPFSWIISNFYAPNTDGAAAVIHASSVSWEKDQQKSLTVWKTVKDRLKIKTGNFQLTTGDNKNTAESINRMVSDSSLKSPQDLRYYARGLFAWPTITSIQIPQQEIFGNKKVSISNIRMKIQNLSALVHSLLDWPVRRLSWGLLASTTAPVPAANIAYDEQLAHRLWDVSGKVAGFKSN